MQDKRSELITVDIQVTSEGLSVSMYRDRGSGPTVEDECWFSWTELDYEKSTDESAAAFELEIGGEKSDGPRDVNTILAEIAALHKQLDRARQQATEEAARERLAVVREELAERRQQRLESDQENGRTQDEIDPRPVPPWILRADKDATVDLGKFR